MNDKEIRKHFVNLVEKCKNNSTAEVTAVTKYLNDLDLDSTYQEALLRTPLKRRDDALQYALKNKQYKLFLALFARVNQHTYGSKYNLLLGALKAKTDKEKHLIAVLNGYLRYNMPIDINTLPDEARKKLYDESWGSEVIKCLYNQTNSFFIPRGQTKAKMQALIYYNTFEGKHTSLSVRYDAKAESESIAFGLKEGGFTVRSPNVEWTDEELLVHMKENIGQIKNETSVLVVCIMSHGGNAFIYDKDGNKVEINTIMQVFEELPDYVPVVILNQSCQGNNDPNQEVDIKLNPLDGKKKRESQATAGTTDGPKEDGATSNDNTTDALGIPKFDDDKPSQIIVKRANTAVVSATPPSFSAFRQLFLFFMAQQLRQADGTTTLESMVNSCSRMMSQQTDVAQRAQAPSIQSVMRNNLILPRALMYDRQVERPGILRRWFATGNVFVGALKGVVTNR